VTDNSAPDPAERSKLHLPVALLATAFVLMVGFQTSQLIREHDNLVAMRASQEATLQQAVKLRQQFDTIMGKTAQLADEGDVGARSIVDDLRRQGIMIKPSGSN
jgi:hypothetical protein